MPQFNVHVLYQDTVTADDQFEAERIALDYIERNIHCEEIFEEPTEVSDGHQ